MNLRWMWSDHLQEWEERIFVPFMHYWIYKGMSQDDDDDDDDDEEMKDRLLLLPFYFMVGNDFSDVWSAKSKNILSSSILLSV